ncbi:MAG: hypothetical protein ACLQO1_25775 [Steroidobacteraceae bacterium]
MTHIYSGSFTKRAPPPAYADGRDECTKVLKRILARGPRRPDSLAKRAPSTDLDVRAEVAISLTDHERALNSHADEAFEEVKKVHATGPRHGLLRFAAQGDDAFESKSVNMVKRAHGRALPVSRAGLPSIDRDLAKRLGKVRVNIEALVGGANLRKSLSGAEWARMSPRERQDYFGIRKGGQPPQSSNASWDNTHANTGAGNNWRDETEMGETVTARIGGQVIGVPSQTNMQAALDAIKKDLRRPKNLLGGPITVGSADHDEDGDELPRKRLRLRGRGSRVMGVPNVRIYNSSSGAVTDVTTQGWEGPESLAQMLSFASFGGTWTWQGVNGLYVCLSGTTANRPTLAQLQSGVFNKGPAAGTKYLDTTLSLLIVMDGAGLWRNPITGALV